MFEGVLSGSGDLGPYLSFHKSLKASTKKTVIYSLLRNLAKIHMNISSDNAARDVESPKPIGGIAALLYRFSRNDEDITKLLVEWLSNEGIVQDLRMRRATIAALTEDLGKLTPNRECH